MYAYFLLVGWVCVCVRECVCEFVCCVCATVCECLSVCLYVYVEGLL